MASLILLAALLGTITLDEAPAWNQMPYSPADGTVVTVNPPPFTWVPPQDALRYVLQIATDQTFETICHQQESVHVSTISLHEALPPGIYWWRYGVKAEEDMLYSQARQFTVPQDVRQWPRPSVDAMAKRVPQEHPRLFVLPDEVPAYRERASSGDLRRVLEKLQQASESHLDEALVAEPPPVTGKGPERGLNYAKIFRETRPPMDRMETCALAYLLSGDQRYGNEAKRRLLHFFGWDPEGTTAYRSNDEPAMWVMMRGVRAYDWTYDLFSEEERARIEPVMRVRAAQFYDHLRNRRRFHSNPYESHAGRTLGFLGEAALAFIHEWPEAREWLDYVTTCFWNVYPAWGKEDGGWHEGPHYWSAYMNFALHFVVPLKIATGADLMQKPFFRNTPYYLLYSNPPYAGISPFGDGENGPGGGSGKGAIMYAFASLLNDPHLRWYAEATGVDIPANILGVVLSKTAPESESPADLPAARHFPGVGLVSLHTDLGIAEKDVHFLIHSDPYGPISHAHADQNAFTLEAFGEPLAIASGYYPWYGSDHHSQWCWETKSSNAITFDGGTGQVKRDARSKGHIVQFIHGDDFDYVEADATAAYQGKLTRCLRQVIHIRPGVFVLLDRVAAREPVTFEWRLHAMSPVTPKDNGMTITREKASLDLTFYAPTDITITTHTGAEPPPENDSPEQYYAIASNSKPASKTNFLAVLIPKRATDTSTVTAAPFPATGGLALQVTHDGTESIVAIQTDDTKPLEAAGITATGTVLALRRNAEGNYEQLLLQIN